MAITKCTASTDVIGSLGTTVQDRGLTTQQFKDKFDEMPEALKAYLNDVLTVEVDAHMADNANKTNKASFNCTPTEGHTINESTCYVKDKLAYLSLKVTKSDGTAFAQGTHTVVTIPHLPTVQVIPFSAFGFTSGGSPREITWCVLTKYNASIGFSPATADVGAVYITGVFEIL